MIKITTKSSGINRAIKASTNYIDRIDKVVEVALSESAIKVKNELNARVEEYNNQAMIFPISNKTVYVGPSIDLIGEVEGLDKEIIYEGYKRCPWFKYIRYIEPSERIPELGVAKNKVRRVAEDMKDVIKNIFKESIQDLFR